MIKHPQEIPNNNEDPQRVRFIFRYIAMEVLETPSSNRRIHIRELASPPDGSVSKFRLTGSRRRWRGRRGRSWRSS
ncbi:hypothetical protein LINPERHAP2_LOCUS23933 [Linum perenne]